MNPDTKLSNFNSNAFVRNFISDASFLIKHKILSRLRVHLKNPKNDFRRDLIHLSPCNSFPNIPSIRSIYLYQTLVHKKSVVLPNHPSMVYCLKNSKSIESLKLEHLFPNKLLLNKLKFALKANSRSLKNFSLSFKDFESHTAESAIQSQLKICSDFRHFKHLQCLHINFSSVTPEIIESVARGLNSIIRLIEIKFDFSHSIIPDQDLVPLKEAIQKQKLIKRIGIQLGAIINLASKKGAFFSCLSNLRNLKEFAFKTTRGLNSDFIDCLTHSLEANNSIDNLDIEIFNSLLAQEYIAKLFASFSKMKLSELIFKVNNLVDTQGIFSNLALDKQKNLKLFQLEINHSRLAPLSLESLGNSLPDCLEAINFMIKNVEVNEYYSHYLLRKIGNMKNLDELKLDFILCNINDHVLAQFVESLPDKPKMRKFEINVKNNSIGDAGLSKLANKLKVFKGLNELDLDLTGNYFTKQGLITLMDSFRSLKNLNHFQLCLEPCNNLPIQAISNLRENLVENIPQVKNKDYLLLTS